MLVQFVLDIGERKLCSPDGNLELREHPGKRSDVIFVAMGKENSPNFLAVLDEIGDIGYNDIDAQ